MSDHLLLFSLPQSCLRSLSRSCQSFFAFICSFKLSCLFTVGTGLLSGIWSLSALAQPSTEQVAKLVANDGKAYDSFGVSVATDGKTAVIGTSKLDANGNSNPPGTVYVFSLQNGSWQQTAILQASDGQPADYFGRYHVAVSGNTIAVAADGTKGVGVDKPGAVYLFTLVNGVWTQIQKIVANEIDYFANDIALDGNTLLVSGSLEESDLKIVYVYTLTNGIWEKTDSLAGIYAGVHGPTRLSISGNIILVGTPLVQIDGITQGAAYIFTFSNGTWTQTARLVASNPFQWAYFGNAVDIDGNTAVIGNNYPIESAYVFTLTNGTWTQTAQLTAPVPYFGRSVAISGNTIIAGTGGLSSQEVYVFSRSNGIWRRTSQLTASDQTPEGFFGVGLSMADSTALIGAFGATVNNNSRQGAAYVFTITPFPLDEPDSLIIALNHTLTEADTAIVELSWQDTENETGYVLESITGSFETGFNLRKDTLPANSTQFAFRAKRTHSDALRSFRLYAFTTQGISPYTPVVSLQVPPPLPFRLNAGASRIVERNGYLFAPDQFYSDGSYNRYFPNSGDIANTVNDIVYQAFRSGENFFYKIPVVNGSYQVTLNFAELYFSQVGERVFSVNLEGGTPELVNFDVVAQAAGATRAIARTFSVTVTDGILDVVFSSTVSRAMIAAIQIVSPASARVSTTGGDSSKESVIELYPNPFADQLTLKISPLTGLAHIRVTDLIGRVVYQATQRSSEVLLNLSGLSKGMYWVTLQTNGGVIYSRKVVKQ